MSDREPSARLEPEYIEARRVLLDALGILRAHRDALVLVGAQAVYLHTGSAQLEIPEYTKDADLAVEPRRLRPAPLIESLLTEAGYYADVDPGRWISPSGVYVDLLVAESLAGPGRRGADLGAHGRRVARRARGLETALVDNAPVTIAALDPADERTESLKVAGPGALHVTKVIKIDERLKQRRVASDKDALDVVRLLRGIPRPTLASHLDRLASDDSCAAVTTEALELFSDLFSHPQAVGTQMATREAAPFEDPEALAVSISLLANDLLDALGLDSRRRYLNRRSRERLDRPGMGLEL